MDRLGLSGQALGIKPVDRNFMLCGPAFTVHNIPCDIAGGSVGDYIDDVPEGNVVVIDNAGRLDCTVWGDILTVMGSNPQRGRHGNQRRLPRLVAGARGELPDLQPRDVYAHGQRPRDGGRLQHEGVAGRGDGGAGRSAGGATRTASS